MKKWNDFINEAGRRDVWSTPPEKISHQEALKRQKIAEENAMEELRVFITDLEDSSEGLTIHTYTNQVYPGSNPKIRIVVGYESKLDIKCYDLEDLDKMGERIDSIKYVTDRSIELVKRASEQFELSSFELKESSIYILLEYKS